VIASVPIGCKYQLRLVYLSAICQWLFTMVN